MEVLPLFSLYQQILKAVRVSDSATRGRIRCWVLQRSSSECSVTVLSMVGAKVVAQVLWRGSVAPAETEFLLDYFNNQAGAGVALVDAMRRQYFSDAGATFLDGVSPSTGSAAVH
ncbi:hypothetical protein PAE975_6008 (plasmid) [Pseudomonas aeruginosa]|jgi:hypothetical protein